MAVVSKAQIVKTLKRFGIARGDIVVAHCGLAAFGKVQGGPATIIEALQETVGKEGVVVMPSLPAGAPYDFRKTPTGMGAVAEMFRKMRGVERSLCPCVPAAALGPKAKELVANHHKCESPYIGGPYDLAALAGGWVLLFGVDHDRNTTLHCAEAYARVPYMNPAKADYIDEKGKRRTYEGVLYAGPHRNFLAADPLLDQAGIQRKTRIGKAVVRCMKGKDLLEFCVARLKEDPALFLTKNEGYYGGIRQRGMVRAAQLREDAFTLIARTSTAGANMEEVLWHAERAGCAALEVDAVDGRDISKLTPPELDALLARVTARNLEVAVVRSNLASDVAFEATLAAGKALGAKAVVAPLTGGMALLKARAGAARKARLRMLFENVAISSDATAALFRELGDTAALAMNPGNFAAVGELAFLGAYGKVKRFIRYLAVTDATVSGGSCLPYGGNGEVKEIMSILRCASFDGWFSLGAAPGVGFGFRRHRRPVLHAAGGELSVMRVTDITGTIHHGMWTYGGPYPRGWWWKRSPFRSGFPMRPTLGASSWAGKRAPIWRRDSTCSAAGPR